MGRCRVQISLLLLVSLLCLGGYAQTFPPTEKAGVITADTANQIAAVVPVARLTNLIGFGLLGNQITDIAPIAGLTRLTEFWLEKNWITDITPLAGLTNLTWRDLDTNQIIDLAPLVFNIGLGAGDTAVLGGNPLDPTPGSQNMRDIEELRRRGVRVQ